MEKVTAIARQHYGLIVLFILYHANNALGAFFVLGCLVLAAHYVVEDVAACWDPVGVWAAASAQRPVYVRAEAYD